MKILRIIRREIRDAFRSVHRNFSLSLASIICITITLIIVGTSIICSLNVNNFASLIKKDVTMVVYVKKDTPNEALDEIENKINANNNVLKCIRKDKKTIKNEMAESDELLNNIMGTWSDEENPLKDTFQVTVKDINLIGKTEKDIESIEEIDFVEYGKKMVENLISIFRIVEKISVAVVLSLIIVTVFLIVNTIKLTIFSRKREISIMRLVGASNSTIKTPFVIEGMILGVLGSILPIIIIIYGYSYVYNRLNGQLYTPLIRLLNPNPFVYIISLLVLTIGIVVGMLGSYQAVRKYLKI